MTIDQNNIPARSNPSDKSLPNIGITMGDPAGIGPEITVKALTDGELPGGQGRVVIGDLCCLQETAKRLGIAAEFYDFESTGPRGAAAIPVYDLDNLRDGFESGKPSAVAGKASVDYIRTAVELWRAGKIDAVTTAPINKIAISMGGLDFPGHTEYLASLTGTSEFAMSFFAGKLCVVLLSTHVSLRNAIELITQENLIRLIRFTDKNLKRLYGRNVNIAVAGLNPHASEGGMFGSEEADEIIPAVERCRDEFDIDVSGPFSPDTIFLRGFNGEFDAVVSCYHDQATIAVKCLSFGSSVNVTLGIPLIRTSVDHGTAYDIAGRGIADSSSLKAAIGLAARFVSIRNQA